MSNVNEIPHIADPDSFESYRHAVREEVVRRVTAAVTGHLQVFFAGGELYVDNPEMFELRDELSNLKTRMVTVISDDVTNKAMQRNARAIANAVFAEIGAKKP